MTSEGERTYQSSSGWWYQRVGHGLRLTKAFSFTFRFSRTTFPTETQITIIFYVLHCCVAVSTYSTASPSWADGYYINPPEESDVRCFPSREAMTVCHLGMWQRYTATDRQVTTRQRLTLVLHFVHTLSGIRKTKMVADSLISVRNELNRKRGK